MKLHCAFNKPFSSWQQKHLHVVRTDWNSVKWGATYAGANPVGAFSKAPITRNGVSARVKGVSNTSGSLIQGYGFVHSTGQSFPIRNNNEVTIMYAPIRYTQTSFEYGNKKDSKLGGAVVGCL